jgi:hypothetical protein
MALADNANRQKQTRPTSTIARRIGWGEDSNSHTVKPPAVAGGFNYRIGLASG